MASTSGKTSIFEIKNLTKVYPNGTVALNNVSLSVKHGEFLVVIGLSGSGKSTLLKCLNQLVTPSAGEIFFRGTPIHHRLSSKELRSLRKDVAMIFQNFNLIRRKSVLTNALTGGLSDCSTLLSIMGWFSDPQKATAYEALKLVGIRDKAKMRVDSLSGGQQQRVAIARALVQRPAVLLADEPVASLDPSMAHSVMDYLEKINKELGITIVCNLHFLSLVRRYATRVIALRGGEIVFQGSPKEIDQDWFRRIYGDEAREMHIQ